MIAILLIVLVVFVLVGVPNWGYHSYGWYPSSILFVVVVVLLVLLLFGRL